MKFDSVTISHFGKLSDRTFRFSDGLNLVCGENEAGKSTLAAYLKFMLYGFPTKGARNAAGNDKLHFMPWNGGAAAGKAEITLSDGTAFLLSRSSGAKNVLSVVEAETGRERRFGKTPGEEFLGVDDAAFSRMAYIRENDVSADRLDSLSESVQNIVLSADESVNIEKAEKKLRDLRNYYRGRGGSGKCAELEDKIRTLRYDFDRECEAHKALLGAEAKLAETKKALERNDEKQALLEKELLNIEAYEAKAVLDAVLASKHALDAAKKAYEKEKADFSGDALSAELLDEILSAAGKVNLSRAQREDAEKALDEARRALSEKEEENTLLSRVKTLSDAPETILLRAKSLFSAAKTRGVAALCFLAFSVGVSVLFALKIFPSYALILAAAGGAGALLFLLFTALFFGKRAGAKNYLAENGFSSLSELAEFCDDYPRARDALSALSAREKQLSDELAQRTEEFGREVEVLKTLLAKCGAETDDPYGFVETMRKKLAALANAENEFRRRESAYEAYLTTNDLPSLNEKAKLLSEVPSRDKKTVLRDLDFLKKARGPLAEKEKEYIRAAAAPSSTRRKPAEILAERTALEAQLAEANENADALALALTALNDACEEMRCGVSPRIAKRACELFRLFTGNENDTLSLTPEFILSAEKEGFFREDGQLSAGTFDAAYLAVRIALCESLFRESPVLILDEPFAHMDENRMRRTLAALKTVSEHFQIFLFSCHTREIAAVKELGGTVLMM